jgi:hypothetical protein
MRTALFRISALATTVLVAHAQADGTVRPNHAVRTYSLMRGDEDWSFLKTPSLRQDFWDPIKYIRTGRLVSHDWWGGARGVRASRQ